MSDTDSSKDQVQKISTRFRINLILFVLLAVLSMYWFYNHLHLYVTETTFIGGTLSLWGAWKLFQTWVKWGIDKTKISLTQRVLDKSVATEYLILGFVLLGFLFFTTSSLYLIYEGAKTGESEFKIEITQNGNPFVEPYTITSYKRIDGRPFFLRFSRDTLLFHISSPRGFKSFEKTFNPWSNINLHIPLDFVRKEYNILRLVPGIKLYFDGLPHTTNDSADVNYYLRIYRNGELYKFIDDIRIQTIYIGADSLDIIDLLQVQDKDEFRSSLLDYLIDYEEITQDSRKKIINILENRSRIISTNEFKEDDQISFLIGKDKDSIPILKQSFTIPEEKKINTIILEE